MPGRTEHIKKAKHNESFYSSLEIDTTPYRDWVVSGVFYTALHLIDAYLATKDVHPFSHGMRDDWVKKNRELEKIWLDYRDLKEFRMKASYKIYEFRSEEIKQDVLPLLSSIRKGLRELSPSLFN